MKFFNNLRTGNILRFFLCDCIYGRAERFWFLRRLPFDKNFTKITIKSGFDDFYTGL